MYQLFASVFHCNLHYCRTLLEKELESVGIRLNKRSPDVYFKVFVAPEYFGSFVTLVL